MTNSARGSFESHTDVGVHPRAGAAEHAAGTFRVTGGGANMWGKEDAFHFVWRRWTGDVTLQADIELSSSGPEPHRKAVLMIRQDLSAGSAYADACIHGDGLTALQYRDLAGGETRQARASLSGARRLVLERRGNRFTMLAGAPGQTLVPCGPVTV